MRHRFSDRLRALARDERGAVAVIFAICIIPAVMLVSGAIDYGRVFKVRSLIQNAADAAVDASRSRLLMGEAEVAQSMRAHLDANLPERLKGLPFELKVADDRRSLEVTLETKVDTTLMAMVGVNSIGMSVTSRAALPVAPAAIGRLDPAGADVGRVIEQLAPGGGGTLPRDPKALTDMLRMPPPPQPSREEIEKLRNSEEMRRAAAEMEARLRAALEAHGRGGGMPDLGRLLRP